MTSYSIYTVYIHIYNQIYTSGPGISTVVQSCDHEHLSCSWISTPPPPHSTHLSSCRSCTSCQRQSTTSSCRLDLLRSSLPTRSYDYPRRLGHRSRPADGPFPSAAWPLLSGTKAEPAYRVWGVSDGWGSSRTLFCEQERIKTAEPLNSLLLENICF